MIVFEKYANVAYLVLCIIWVAISMFFGVKSIVIKLKKKKANGEEINANDMKLAYLEIREVAREAIYEAEKQFGSVKNYGLKTGAFKLDSVLKTVDNECLRRGIAYNKEEVTAYINEEVSKMKEVK